MGNTDVRSGAVATIAAVITPALLLLGSAYLVASALMGMARVVDQAQILSAIATRALWTKSLSRLISCVHGCRATRWEHVTRSVRSHG